MAALDNSLPPNFPSPPSPPTMTLLTHPRDLVVDDRNFYTQIQFIPYNGELITSLLLDSQSGEGFGLTNSANPTGGIVLPIPVKLNDLQTVTWTDVGLTGELAGAASQLALQAATRGANWNAYQRRSSILSLLGSSAALISVLSGYQLNPALWMMFKNPEFKTFQFQWQFTPANEQESHDIVNIVNYFKFHSLPFATGPVYEYPSIALIRFYPNDFFTVRMKPCAILNVGVDYTGAGMPSFFDNGAPTVVNLTVVAKEIDLWTKNNFNK